MAKSKTRQWIFTLAILLSLFGSSFLLYKWWQTKQNTSQIQAKEQILNQAEPNQVRERQQAFQSYQNQQKQLPQVLILAKNPTIYEFFNDLLGGYAYRFAEKQNLSDYCLPLEFGGFYSEKSSSQQNFRELGIISRLSLALIKSFYLIN